MNIETTSRQNKLCQNFIRKCCKKPKTKFYSTDKNQKEKLILHRKFPTEQRRDKTRQFYYLQKLFFR